MVRLAAAAEDRCRHAVPQAPYLPFSRGGMAQVASPPLHRETVFSYAIVLPRRGDGAGVACGKFVPPFERKPSRCLRARDGVAMKQSLASPGGVAACLPG